MVRVEYEITKFSTRPISPHVRSVRSVRSVLMFKYLLLPMVSYSGQWLLVVTTSSDMPTTAPKFALTHPVGDRINFSVFKVKNMSQEIVNRSSSPSSVTQDHGQVVIESHCINVFQFFRRYSVSAYTPVLKTFLQGDTNLSHHLVQLFFLTWCTRPY